MSLFAIDGTPATVWGARLLDHPEGLTPDPRHTTVQVPGRPGLYLYRSGYGTRSLSLSLLLEADDRTGVTGNLRALAAALDPAGSPHVLTFDLQPDVEYRVALDGQPDVEWGWDWARVDLDLVMHDPFVYATDDTAVTVADLASGQTIQLVNPGTAPVPLDIAVSPAADTQQAMTPAASLGVGYVEAGPLYQPSLTVDGVTFGWDGTVDLGETLTVNTDRYTVLLDGVNALDLWDPTTDFPTLPPGTSQVAYQAANGQPADLTFTFRERNI